MVVEPITPRGTASIDRELRLVDVAACLRLVFCGGDVLGSVGARRAAALVGREPNLPQQIEANLASIERLNTQLRLNGENQLRTMDRRERLEKELAASATVRPVGGEPSGDEQKLTNLRQQLDELKARLENHDWKDILAHSTGHYVLFNNSDLGRASARECYRTCHGGILFIYKMNMELQLYPNPNANERV